MSYDVSITLSSYSIASTRGHAIEANHFQFIKDLATSLKKESEMYNIISHTEEKQTTQKIY